MEVKSIADIAALGGVPKTTVSAVLNGKVKHNDRQIPGNNYFSVISQHYEGAKKVISILAEDSDEIA